MRCLTSFYVSTALYSDKCKNINATKRQRAVYARTSTPPRCFREMTAIIHRRRGKFWDVTAMFMCHTFLALFELAISAAFPSALAILLEVSFPGGLCSMGLFTLLIADFPCVFFTCFLLCLLKCASCRVVSSLLSWKEKKGYLSSTVPKYQNWIQENKHSTYPMMRHDAKNWFSEFTTFKLKINMWHIRFPWAKISQCELTAYHLPRSKLYE